MNLTNDDFLKFWGYFPYNEKDHTSIRKEKFNEIIYNK
jgi:hypothetical protein